MKKCTIWDYSQNNINFILQKYPQAKCRLLKLGYSKYLDYNLDYNENDKDIDILFLGQESDRRNAILDRLIDDGYKVVIEQGKTDEELAKLVQRAKINLNIYYKDFYTKCISSTRLVPLVGNKGLVISEECVDEDQNNDWKNFTISVSL